ELYGVMVRRGADGAFLVTSGEFSEPLLDEFRDDSKLTLMNGKDLMLKLEEVQKGLNLDPAAQNEGLLQAFKKVASDFQQESSGVIRVPRCPRCGAAMVLRQNS